VELGVHQVIGGGPMPTYIRRPHDELLRAVLDPAVPASRLVVVRGGSSTGKTRAAYEAVAGPAGQLADWHLDYPLNVAAFKERLDAGIPARTVLWLGELRQYAEADSGAEVLGRLADLLIGDDLLVITTMWPEQWNTYIDAARAGPGTADPAGTAGRLLERLPKLTGSDPGRIDPARGGVIDIPDRFTAAEMATAATIGDLMMAEAVAAASSAGQDGQVTQYLAGVPDLLHRYVGPGGNPYGQAVITAAMDATRLGRGGPLPAALVQESAVGYLTGPQRTVSIENWRDTALAWAAEELKGAVRALEPVAPPSGTGIIGYQVADYLDQYGRRTRQDQLGPASLWEALITRTVAASDLIRLGDSAHKRGLYWHAANAVSAGNATAAGQLIALLRELDPDSARLSARWAVNHASAEDPAGVAELLLALRGAGAGTGDAAAALATRAAHRASLENPWAVALLLGALRDARARDAAAALATRIADHASLGNLAGVAWLLRMLRGQEDAEAALASRAAHHANLEDPAGVAALLGALREAEADDAVTALVARDPAGHASLDNPAGVAALLGALRQAEADDAVTALLARDPAGHASLDNPAGVAMLVWRLRQAGADDAAAALATRAAHHASLDNLAGAAMLVWRLRQAGTDDDAAALATRAAHHASLDNPAGVAELLRRLREAGADDAVTALLARDPAGHASLDNPAGVAALLGALRQAEADDAVTALLARDPAGHASLDNPAGVAELLRRLREAGADAAAAALLARDPAGHSSLHDSWAVAQLLDRSYVIFYT
jgi:hypothetical protein